MHLRWEQAGQRNKRYLLEQAVRVHANTIRIWGGGIYETKAFYDAADELGLMIMQDGSFFSQQYPKYQAFYNLVREEVVYNGRRLATHPSLIVYSGNNEGSVFGNVPLYVDTQLVSMAAANPNVVIYPSCPSNGWETLEPHPVPRPNEAHSPKGRRPLAQCEEDGVQVVCPHDDHYYGPCGTIPDGAQFGSEFGWPSADIFTVTQAITPAGADILRPTTGASNFLDFRSTIKNPDWTVEAMLYANATLTNLFPTHLGPGDASPQGLERWLCVSCALCVSNRIYSLFCAVCRVPRAACRVLCAVYPISHAVYYFPFYMCVRCTHRVILLFLDAKECIHLVFKIAWCQCIGNALAGT